MCAGDKYAIEYKTPIHIHVNTYGNILCIIESIQHRTQYILNQAIRFCAKIKFQTFRLHPNNLFA